MAEAITQSLVKNNSMSLLLPPYGSQQLQASAKTPRFYPVSPLMVGI